MLCPPPCNSWRSDSASTSPSPESCGRSPCSTHRSGKFSTSQSSPVPYGPCPCHTWSLGDFNQPTAGVIWPASLQSPSFEVYFNKRNAGVMRPTTSCNTCRSRIISTSPSPKFNGRLPYVPIIREAFHSAHRRSYFIVLPCED